MKKITAIVRPEKLEPLKEALFAAQVGGMTVSQVQGCGSQHGWKEYYRGTEVMLNMIPKVKFELVVDDAEVAPLVDLVRATACTGEVGDGKIFIFPVEEVVRIRTGETGVAAVSRAQKVPACPDGIDPAWIGAVPCGGSAAGFAGCC